MTFAHRLELAERAQVALHACKVVQPHAVVVPARHHARAGGLHVNSGNEARVAFEHDFVRHWQVPGILLLLRLSAAAVALLALAAVVVLVRQRGRGRRGAAQLVMDRLQTACCCGCFGLRAKGERKVRAQVVVKVNFFRRRNDSRRLRKTNA